MTYVLLTGAGFSRNWGGWLATEAFGYLVGCPEIDDNLRKLLWKSRGNGGGFEDALAQVQCDYNNSKHKLTKKRLDVLQSKILGMFSYMDQAFGQTPFEQPTQSPEYSVRNFLGKFDAIFTLNHDLLLERHYPADDGHIAGHRAWRGWYLPGTKLLDPALCTFPHVHTKTEIRVPAAEPVDFKEEAGVQPYFKLHGSINWIASEGHGQLLIMGGNKAVEISQYPILKWYHKRFEEHLSRPGTRLMVIGYSFGDHHINDAIVQAADKGGLQLFIVDPQGVDVLDKQDPKHALRASRSLTTSLQPCIIGASRRPLTATFGHDHVEYSKIIRFFAT